MRIFVRTVGIVALAIWAGVAHAGPVSSPEGFPAADMNASGDFLLVGDRKGYVRWEGRFVVVPERLGGVEDLFSGGVAQRTASEVAVACGGERAAVATRSARGVTWRTVVSGEGKLRCAMLRNGTWAVARLARREITLSSGGRVSIPWIAGAASRLAALGDSFVFIDGSKALFVKQDGQSRAAASPLPATHELTRIDGGAAGLLSVSGDGAHFAATMGTDEQGFPRLAAAGRIAAAPCEDRQLCGASVADDGSWLLTGYWGTWGGRGQQARRVDEVVNLSAETGGVAIAHSGAQGEYVYAAGEAGDMGRLALAGFDTFQLRSAEGSRWLVWTRPEPGERALLRTGHERTPRTLAYKIWHGALPAKVPPAWVAWEREVVFDAPRVTEANGGQGEWWANAIGRSEAWEALPEAAVVRVGVVDSGADLDHPWMREALARRAEETAGNGIDDDGNGLVDDVVGYDFVDEDAWPQDEFGHGAHVAGLLAARRGQTPYATGKNVELLVARALDAAGKSNSIDLFRAITYVVESQARILNCSWGGGRATQALRDAFAFAHQRGVLVFCSAGNDGLDIDVNAHVPAGYDGVNSIGSVMADGRLSRTSNFGAKNVLLLAPGDDIASALPGGGWGLKSGTSMASPIAASSVAWLLGALRLRNPEDSWETLGAVALDAVCRTAEPVSRRSRCGHLRAGAAARWLRDGQ